jgi:N-succinyldiaminopimelate aminotransferase
MPRFPHHSKSAEGLSDRVFGHLMQRAQERGIKVFPLHVGDTYREPLEAARAEAQRTMDRPRLHNYSPVQGEPELLEAIKGKIARRHGVQLQTDNIQVMSGATAGLGVIATALLAPGDEMLLPSPFWPLVRGVCRFRGAVAVEVPLFTRLNEPGFDPIAALEAALTEKTAALYINSPHNPTGATLSVPVLERMVAFARQHNLWLFTDEVYEDIYFEGQAPRSIWTLPGAAERSIVTHSVSKAYGLAGARVGFTHGPREAMQVIRGVQTFYTYCAPRPLQIGAAAALSQGDSWLAEARAEYGAAARATAEALGTPVPSGGTFLFFDLRPHLRAGETPMQLLERCVDNGVMLTPGSASGEAFDGWARVCFTSVAPAELAQALAQLKATLADR